MATPLASAAVAQWVTNQFLYRSPPIALVRDPAFVAICREGVPFIPARTDRS